MDQSPLLSESNVLPPSDAAAPLSDSNASAAPAAAAGGNGVTLETLSRMLDAMPNSGGGGSGGARPVIATAGDLLRTSELAELVDGSDDADLSAVFETIPAIERNRESVKELLRSQAVQSQALALTRALLEAPPSDVLPSLGLPLPDTPGSMGMKALIEAIKKAANQP